MTAKTHMLGGALAGQLLCLSGGANDAVPISAVLITTGAAVIGSLIPDIDHRGSAISHSSLAARITSCAVSGVTHHRGVIHTPFFIIGFAAVLTLVSFFMHGIGYTAFLGLVAGMLSHLVLDTLNPGGIMWLWPISKKHLHLARITTGTIGEWLAAAGLAIADACLAVLLLPEAMMYFQHFFSNI